MEISSWITPLLMFYLYNIIFLYYISLEFNSFTANCMQ